MGTEAGVWLRSAWGHFKPGEKLWQTWICWFGGGYRALGAVSPAGVAPCDGTVTSVTICNPDVREAAPTLLAPLG